MGHRTLLRTAVGGVLAVGCGPAVPETDGSGATSTGSAAPSSSAGGGSSTGMPQPEGPGCGVTPVCDRGRFDGHVRIATADDLEAVAGYTEVTGMLEVIGSQDLVCLDALACLEVVGRDVRIQRNAALQSTQGLSNLRDVGGASRDQAPTIFVSENEVLERLSGFAVTMLEGSLVLWRNPQLAEVDGLGDTLALGGFVALENPMLEHLSGLHGAERSDCRVNHNPRLCAPELDMLCGETWGVIAGVDCPESPSPPVYEPGGSIQCAVSVEDCPDGQKCMPVGDGLQCRPVVEPPRSAGESCAVLGESSEGLDDCERHTFCNGDRCLAMAFGSETALACPSSNEVPRVDASGTLLLCMPSCDPLSPNCSDGFRCIWNHSSFSCAPEAPARGLAEGCEVFPGCDAGLACVDSMLSQTCAQDGSSGCCLPLCDVDAPDCPEGMQCLAWWDADDSPPPRVEHVGVCIDV